MEYGFPVLMFLFSGALLLYAGILFLTKDCRMLPARARQSVKPKDPERYARQLSKVIALTAAAPALGGLAGFLHPLLAVAVLVIGTAAAIWAGTTWMKEE